MANADLPGGISQALALEVANAYLVGCVGRNAKERQKLAASLQEISEEVRQILEKEMKNGKR